MTILSVGGQPGAVIPTSPRAIAADERFRNHPQGFYAQLIAALRDRLGWDEGAAEARRLFEQAAQIADVTAGGAS